MPPLILGSHRTGRIRKHHSHEVLEYDRLRTGGVQRRRVLVLWLLVLVLFSIGCWLAALWPWIGPWLRIARV